MPKPKDTRMTISRAISLMRQVVLAGQDTPTTNEQDEALCYILNTVRAANRCGCINSHVPLPKHKEVCDGRR